MWGNKAKKILQLEEDLNKLLRHKKKIEKDAFLYRERFRKLRKTLLEIKL